MTYKKQWSKSHYRERVDKGICPKCGVNSTEGTGYLVCAECRHRAAEQKKIRRKIKREQLPTCDMNCLMCRYDDCINGNAPITHGESRIMKEFIPDKSENVTTVSMLLGR